MQFIIRAIIPALIPIILGFFLSHMDRSNRKETIKNITREHIVIRLPKAYLWIGCLDISFFITCLFLMTWFPNDTTTAWVWMVFLLFVLIGAAIVFKTQIWKIDIFRSENYFLYRGWLFRTYRILFSDCVKYRFGANTLILETKERTFHIDTHATNFEFLLAILVQHKVMQIK